MKYLFLYGSTISTLVLGYSFWNVSQAINAELPTGADGDRTSAAASDAKNAEATAIKSPGALLLEQARASVQANRFREAFTLLDRVPVQTTERRMAMRYKEFWSRELLRRAVDKYTKGDLVMALKMLDAVPSNTTSYRQSIELTSLWKTEAKYAKAKDSSKDFLFRSESARTIQRSTGSADLFYPSTETISQVMTVPRQTATRSTMGPVSSSGDRMPAPAAPRLMPASPFSAAPATQIVPGRSQVVRSQVVRSQVVRSQPVQAEPVQAEVPTPRVADVMSPTPVDRDPLSFSIPESVPAPELSSSPSRSTSPVVSDSLLNAVPTVEVVSPTSSTHPISLSPPSPEASTNFSASPFATISPILPTTVSDVSVTAPARAANQ